MIRISQGPLAADLIPRGATLTGLWHQEHSANLVLGYRASTSYQDDPFYLGAIVGPLANRVGGASVALDGQSWHLDANEGANCLHGGADGLTRQDWQVEAQTADAVTFALYLSHGAGGLPGNRQISVCYRLSDAALNLEITATSDHDTYFNAAHHPYWRLDARNCPPRHMLTVAAQNYLPVTKESLPLGTIEQIRNTAYDFRAERLVPTDMTLDANLCLSNRQKPEPQFAARLTSEGGPELTIETTEPGLQVYNGSGLKDAGALLRDDDTLYPYAGLALEPQGWPDAPNQPAFPSVLLRTGSTYRQKTIYRLTV